MSYDGTTLTVTITDTNTNASASHAYPVNIPQVIGSNTGYVGFTAGTGGATAVAKHPYLDLFSQHSHFAQRTVRLGVGPASANSVNLTWVNNASNQTGFHLDRATDSGFTMNLITENLPANATSFTDTATGLAAAGGTYYYRIRAYNSAGDSGNSNVASVTIPLAPADQPTGYQRYHERDRP